MQVFCATLVAWSYNVHEDTVVQCLFTRKLFQKRQTAVVCTAKDSMNTVFQVSNAFHWNVQPSEC